MKKSATISQSISIETRLTHESLGCVNEALSDYASLFSYLSRIYFRHWSTKQFSAKKEDKPNKKRFMLTHKISGRQFNAIKVSIEGMVASQKSNLPRYLTEVKSKIHGIKKVITKKKALIKKHKANKRFDLQLIQVLALQGKNRRLSILFFRQETLKKQIKNKEINVCFGSNRLFRKQFQLTENNYASHKDWLNDWQASRASQLFILGSSDEASGNQGCTLFEDGECYKLRLLLPEALRQKGEKYLWIEDITFKYLPEIIKQAVLSNRHRTEQKSYYAKLKKSDNLPLIQDDTKGLIQVSESVFLADLGQALSYRFIKDNKGWRIIISTNLTKPLPKDDFDQGALGIDFNDGFVSVAHINEKGQKISLMDLSYDAGFQATSRQNKTKMQEVSLTITDYARGANVPIVIESLDFKNKKAGLQKRNNEQYNQMISQLSYVLFRQAIAMQCFKKAIALVEVNPAHTSIIGRLKYAKETNFNTHQAAAWVIARRAMGLKDRLPKHSTIKLPSHVFAVFTAPEDAGKTPKETLFCLGKAFNQWLTAIIKAERLRVQQLKKLIAPLDDLIEDF